MALTTRLTAHLETTHTDALDLATVTDALNYLKRIDLASGTGANQADIIFHDRRSINASSADDLDLTAVLSNAFGDALTFARIKLLLIYSDPGNEGTLEVGADAAAVSTLFGDASDAVVVRPGGLLLLAAPDATAYAVTATSADILQVTNTDDAAVSYDVVLIGASA